MEQDNDVLEPIPQNFVERAIYAAKSRVAEKNRQKNEVENQNNCDEQPHGVETQQSEDGYYPKEARSVQNTDDRIPQKIKYFEKAGVVYKMVGDELYVIGWKDLKQKYRIINTKNGRELPSDGKKIQVYGWVKIENCDTPAGAEGVYDDEEQ